MIVINDKMFMIEGNTKTILREVVGLLIAIKEKDEKLYDVIVEDSQDEELIKAFKSSFSKEVDLSKRKDDMPKDGYGFTGLKKEKE